MELERDLAEGLDVPVRFRDPVRREQRRGLSSRLGCDDRASPLRMAAPVRTGALWAVYLPQVKHRRLLICTDRMTYGRCDLVVVKEGTSMGQAFAASQARRTAFGVVAAVGL